jgi:hypothetical protein
MKAALLSHSPFFCSLKVAFFLPSRHSDSRKVMMYLCSSGVMTDIGVVGRGRARQAQTFCEEA